MNGSPSMVIETALRPSSSHPFPRVHPRHHDIIASAEIAPIIEQPKSVFFVATHSLRIGAAAAIWNRLLIDNNLRPIFEGGHNLDREIPGFTHPAGNDAHPTRCRVGGWDSPSCLSY